jgi:hypothetical protein
MPNKTRRRARRRQRASVPQLTQKMQQVSVRPKQKRKATPFADAGAIAGQRLGSMFGFPMLKGVGRWLGSGIGTVLGSGDYSIVGPHPGYNVLFNSNQVPKFSSTRQTNIVSHREYLGDIFGTAGFNNTSYPLNPGVATTFPWLSSIAQNYQQYKFHGVMFEFKSLITDFVTSGAPGVVVMATNYNSDVPIYTTKQEMENSEYAVSVKPTCDLMHGVECATNQTVLSELYIRSGSVPAGQDLRLYDLGNFQFATQANPVQDLGELWVTYIVEFFKPTLPADVGGNVLSANTARGSVTITNPFGTTSSGFFGTLDLVVTTDTLSFTGQPGNHYAVVVLWNSGTTTTLTVTATPTGMTVTNALAPQDTPEVGVTCIRRAFSSTYKCALLNPGLVSLKMAVTGTIGGLCTVFVSEISSSIN